MARQVRPPVGKSNATFERNLTSDGPSFSRPASARTPRLVPVTPVRVSPRIERPASASNINKLSSRGLSDGPVAKTAHEFGGGTINDAPETLSARSSASSTAEFLLTRSKDYNDKLKAMERASTENLGEYNEYSRPRPSKNVPLRSVFLDPETNNFAPSKTRSELMRKIKNSGIPHSSYDIDGDGWVSREDYFVSKRFDLDGNGIIDPDEKLIAKKIIAEEFFNAHMHHIHLFGKKYAQRTLKENVNNLAKSAVFERTYNRLKATELKLKQGGSSEMIDGMTLANNRLTKFNFYTNKFDTTAWNDYDAIPRAENFMLPTSGSRRNMLFERKRADMQRNASIFTAVQEKSDNVDFRRINLITDITKEN